MAVMSSSGEARASRLHVAPSMLALLRRVSTKNKHGDHVIDARVCITVNESMQSSEPRSHDDQKGESGTNMMHGTGSAISAIVRTTL